ncbi:MAG: tRNA-dihydrouridine synthase [Candidatus Vogelbacteria bacterium]
MKNFWAKLSKPFFCLAPMANVTDAAFRRIIAKYGKADVMFTEFVSADGLCHPKGREKLLIDLIYSESERPIVAQLFTAHPEKMEEAARLIQKLGFDGLDINMGCPDRAVEKQGAGAMLMKNPKLAQEIIQAAQTGAPKLPISVKTRLGYYRDELDPPAGGWLSALLETDLAAITIHARTRKEMSKVPAHWEAITRAVKIRNDLKSQTLIIGNGDVADLAEARQRAEETSADGIMLGRAIFGNPWLFANLAYVQHGSQIERPPKLLAKADENQKAIACSRSARGSRDQLPSGFPNLETRLRVLVEHTKLFEELLGPAQGGSAFGGKNFAIMKKHFKAYVVGDKELCQELMRAPNGVVVEQTIDKYLASMLS